MLLLVMVATVWAAVLVHAFVRNRRDAHPDNSVMSFRAQLSTLERATPGTSLRTMGAAPAVTPRSPAAMSRSEAKRRRRDVLVALAGTTLFTFLLVVTVGGALATLLFLVSGASLGAFVYALRQLQLRSMERVAKVRTLRPRATPAPVLAMRRTVSS